MPEDCLFCDPSRSRRVYANTTCYARYDNFPATEGHVEIVPFRHVTSFFDLRPDEAFDAYALLRHVSRYLSVTYRPDSWNIGVNDGPTAGQTIPHLHIHLIPRYAGDQDDPRGGIRRGLPGWGQLAAALTRKDIEDHA